MDENNARDMLLFAIANSLDVMLKGMGDGLNPGEADEARVAMFQAANTLADVITARNRSLAS